MRVIDLLALLSDHTKNTAVQVRSGDAIVNIASFTLDEVLEEPRLILVPKDSGHPLKLWELAVLLNKPALLERYVYIQDDAGVRPAFGFQRQGAQLVLN